MYRTQIRVKVIQKTESDKSVTLKRAKLSLSNGSGIPESLSNVAFGFTENMRQSKFPHIKNTGYQDSAQAFREIVENANPTGKGICDALNSSGIGYRNWKVTSESSDKIVIQASDTLGNKHNLAIFPVKQKSQESSNKPTSDKGQDSSTSQVKLDKTKSSKVSETQAKDLSQMSESEIKSRMKQIATRIGEVSNEMNNNPKSSAQLNSVATSEQKKEYDALIEENAELMIELGKRQRKDDSGKDNVKQKDSSTTSSISFDLPSGKNTKQAVTDLLASHSRSDIMSAAKSAGITWKENAHEGINWMRASMAIQKYMSK